MSHIARILLLLGVFSIAACQSSAPVRHPPLTFTQYQPIHISVARIDIIEEYQSPRKAPYVEHLIPYSPAEAMNIWVKDRLRAVGGGDKTLQVIIRDGSVTLTPLGKAMGFEGFLTVEPDKRYDAKLVVEMRIYGRESAISEANIQVQAARSITIQENASLNQRDAQLRRMIADLMTGLNAEIEKNLYQYMFNHVSYFHNP